MESQVLRTLGQRIVAARLAYLPRRMSQRELARRTGVSTKSLNQIETGETVDPKSSIIRKISDVLGVSADWLLKGHPSEESSTQQEEHGEDREQAA
jgi:transcriptional regulator with XRE-family HTH domain